MMPAAALAGNNGFFVRGNVPHKCGDVLHHDDNESGRTPRQDDLSDTERQTPIGSSQTGLPMMRTRMMRFTTSPRLISAEDDMADY